MLSRATLFATLALIGSSALAQAQGVCDQLWYERNAQYKAAGYCFKTARAIQTFGNAGCIYQVEGQVPLTPWQRQRIAYIIGQERANGCRG